MGSTKSNDVVHSSIPFLYMLIRCQRPANGFLAFLKDEAAYQRVSGHFGVSNNYLSSGRSFRRFLQSMAVVFSKAWEGRMSLSKH